MSFNIQDLRNTPIKRDTREKIDVVCPIHEVSNLYFLKSIIDSWYRSIPINQLIIGLTQNALQDRFLKRYLENLLRIKCIDQSRYITLGACLQELFEATTTPYFVYLHSDVELPQKWFSKIYPQKQKGILESIKDITFGGAAQRQAENGRAYSGAQLIFKKAVENLEWEDDFIYTNEDLLVQNIVEHRGYPYIKTSIPHIHHRVETKRTQPRETILEWQWKGIVKYGYPNKRLIRVVNKTLRILKREYNKEYRVHEFIKKNNPLWSTPLRGFSYT